MTLETDGSPAVSVIVPVLDEEQSLARCLEAIRTQDYPPERVEILAVDGGSTDRGPEILDRFAAGEPRCRRLDCPGQPVSGMLNAGIALATGEVIVRIDAHAFPAPDYIRTCVETLRLTGADNAGGPMRPVGDSTTGEAVARAMCHPFGVGTARFRFARQLEEVDTVYMGAFRRRVFSRVGGFNESLVRNQDYELNYRIRRAGGKVVVNPAIRSTYRTRASLGALWRQYFSYGFWKQRMLKSHPRSLRPRQLVAPALMLALLAGAIASLLSLGPAAQPSSARWSLVIVAMIYAVANLTVSAAIAARHGPRLLLRLPIVFATLHFAWGLGFLSGLARRPAGGKGSP